MQIIGENTDWQVQTICSGDCNEIQVIPNLMEGDYTVKVQLNASDGSNCYREENVNVSTDGDTDGGNSGNDNSNDNDNVANCDNLQFISESGQITVSGLNTSFAQVQIIGANTGWQVETICSGDCDETQVISNLAEGDYSVKVQLNASDGSNCYREENVNVSTDVDIGGGNSGNDNSNDNDNNNVTNCDNIQIIAQGNTINITALNAPIEIVQIFDQNYNLVFRCQGTECGSEQVISNLAAGNYFVTIQAYTADWNFICAKENILVQVGGGGSNETNDCASTQLDGFNFVGYTAEKAFFLSNNRLPFNEAKQACINANSRLASTLTQEQISILNANVTGEAFIDLSDANVEGTFQWADNSTFNGTVFDNNAANDFVFIADWASDLIATNEGAWKNFICELPCNTLSDDRASSATIEKAIKLFPNPVQSEMTLQVIPLMGTKGSISIFNLYGQKVKQFNDLQFEEAHLSFDMTGLENGLYHLTIKSDNRRLISKRFVVEHWR